MILVVPDTINGLADLESKIVNYDLLRLTKGSFLKPTILTMPKFKLDKTISLKSSLIKVRASECRLIELNVKKFDFRWVLKICSIH